MGSRSCCCSHNTRLLREFHPGEHNKEGERVVKGISISKFENSPQEATCANNGVPKKCELLRCQCKILNAADQFRCNVNGRDLPSGKKTGKLRNISPGMCDPILQSSWAGTKTQFGLVTSASANRNEDDISWKTSRMKLSVRTFAIAACFGGIGGLITALLRTLPPDFQKKWRILVEDSPPAESPSQSSRLSPTVLFDRHGVVIATIGPGGYSCKQDDTLLRSSGKSMSVSSAEIPSWMWQAVVASEDRRFFQHPGVDPRGLARAVLSLTASGGGSTITQQLVKNVVLTNERKWTRKLLEMILALILETQISKWDIIHLYLKKIYWGHGVYGIEGASALYFGKQASLLTLGECAMLAGIIPAPEVLSPYRDPSRGKKPQGRALRRMVEAGFLDATSAAEVVRQPLHLAIESNEGTSGPWKAPYFVSEVLYELTEKYGWYKVACGGLQVHTTLDLSMQTIAEKVVQDHLLEYDSERIFLSQKALQQTQERLAALQVERQEKMAEVIKAVIERRELDESALSPASLTRKAAKIVKQYFPMEEYLQATVSKYQEEIKAAEQSRMEAAMVAIDPMCGAVRVLVGGRDYYKNNFNRGTQAFRSPGSAFKPVVYLAALAEGFERDHVLSDEPFSVRGFPPENLDHNFSGQVTLEDSLVYSLNGPTVRLCAEIGVDKVCDMGRALGIETYLPDELTLSLGGCEVTPMQLATVYATIAAGGMYCQPHLITRIESQEGQVLEEQKVFKGEQQVAVVNEDAVVELRRLLQVVVDEGTGRAAQLGRPCAGMAGTSNEHKDIWFAGFTPELACVVWLGYDDDAPVGGLHPSTGASHAAPLWKQFMKAVHEGVPVRKFDDVGTDKYGSKAHGQFVKRSRRTTRIGLHKIRKNHLKKMENYIPWKQVWDWETASRMWEEQEKMEDWVAFRTGGSLAFSRQTN